MQKNISTTQLGTPLVELDVEISPTLKDACM
jgi:hypothetical protein